MPGTLSNGNDSGNKATSSAPSNTLEADIALLSNLLSQNVDESDPDVVELLQRLEAAEGIADGVESRLDGIINHLDNLLSDLEAKSAPTQSSSDPAADAGAEEEVVTAAAPQTGPREVKMKRF